MHRETALSEADFKEYARDWSSKLCVQNLDPETSKDLYNTWALTYDQNLGPNHWIGPTEAADEMARRLRGRKECRILDLASGTGLVGEQLVKRGFTDGIDGIDASPGMIALARAKQIYSKLIEAYISAEGMPFEQDTYDALVAVGCILPGHITADCFEEFIRVIKPGGFLVMIIREKCFHEFEAEIQRLENEGKWTCIEKSAADVDYTGGPGVLITTQIF